VRTAQFVREEVKSEKIMLDQTAKARWRFDLKLSRFNVPGTDAARAVIACGERVTQFCSGDRVACGAWFGASAERMTAKAYKTARLTDNTDFVVGSTVLHIYLTAWYTLVEPTYTINGFP
jgi:NADPH:quinone reductase-like Zn-dependent oxidoreductase